MRPKRRAMTEGSWFTAARTKLRVALMAQALALGCASSEESSELGEPVAQQASELAASTTLPQALSGKIQPITNAPGGVISAGIRGEPAVGHDGSANYRIPIGVPDGIDGLSPRLAIEYNSEAGQGILGPRFALAGLSVITRCAKTRAKDGAAGGIDFFGSTFCLDGEPLVMMSSTSTSAEFRAERNSFRKIVGTKNSLGDFVRFQVFEPDGRIGSYGASSSSRLHGNPVRFAGGTERDVTYAYHIDSISDRYSNQIRFTYKNVNSATTGKTRVQELVPDRISWGDSRQLRVMLFGYEGIPGGASINPQQRSIRGLEIGRGQYLQTISINGPDGVTSSSTALLKVYFFDYATSSRTGGPTIVTGRRVLRGIRECDGNSVCKKPTSIEWEAGSPDFVRTDLAISDFHTPDQTGFPMDPNFPQPWPPTTYKKYARFLVADMNRDGMDDIVYRGYLAPHHSGEQDCLGWIVRLASRAPGSSGAPKYDYVVPLSTLGGDPDWTCRAWIVSPTHYRDWAGSSPNLTGGIAYPGDLILADLDGDDYTDIISAISKNASTPTSRIINVFGYRAYLNSTIVGGGALTFMSPVNFLVSAASDVRPNGIELAPPGSGVLPLTNALLALGDIDGNGISEEFDTADLTNPHRTEYESGPALPVDRLDKTYSMQIFGRERWTRDCPSADATGTCGAAGSRNMGAQSESFVYDGYGNVTESVARFRDENNVEMASQTENRYFAPDEGKWLLSLPDPARSNTLTSTSASPAQSVTRTTKLGADPTTGALTSIEIEPSGDGSLHSKRSFGRNGKGQITSVTDQDFAGSPVRTTSFLYEDSDGVYVTTVIDAKGFRTRIWRHPGLGLVVEVDDPNGLASTYSYDTLGRPLTRTNPSGETIRFAYFDGPADGTDFGVYPDASSGSYVSIHLDALGQEIKRDTPVGPGKSLLTEQELDERGRVVTSFLSSWNGTTRTDLNQEYFYYDDLNRVTASGGKVSDGTFRWRYYQYDGFSATEYDQAGRSSTVVTDALGRRTVQRAVLASGQSDALFSYGAFGLLVQQRTSDQTGRTDFGYDVLGRPTAITRTDTATRRATFNAFGDQVGAYKQLDGGGAVDNLVYGRDVLGRLTSVTGSNVNRSFSWDAPASSPGTPAPNAKLKLVDVIDGTNTGVHFDYGSNGFVRTKTWSAAVSSTLTEIGTAQFDYDGQGRLAKLTYPKVGAWSNPLAVTYDYDPYTGNVRSLSDAAVPGRAIWAVTATSERGQPVRELMDLPGGPTIARESTYYPQTGLIQTASISSTNGAGTTSFQSMGYQYDAGGLPSYRQRTGPGGNFREWFEHDNLGRLIHWIPGQCCGGSIDVNVYYDYDSDGNLTSRSWDSLEGTGLTTYTKLTGRFTDHPVRVQTSINGTLDSSQTYYYDKWGRLYGTPVAALDYNAADEVIGIREINDPGSGGGSGGVTGPYDTIRRDGFGRRLVTSYADLSNQITATLYTFDDLAEIRSSSAGTEERCRLTANGKLVGELVRSSNTSTRTGTFYLADNVGSVVAEASSAGVVTPRARRDPFGNLIANPLAPHLPRDPTAANQDGSGRMAFAGHARDNNWGLVDMGARFYSPRLGRFAAPDPIVSEPFDRRAHNPFAYVWNSPVARRDPDGREGQPCPEGETCDDGSWELCPGGCWETTKHAAGAAKDGVVDFFDWVFGGGSSQPSTPQFRIVAPNNIVSSPQVSSNAMATTGKRGGTGGTTETNRTCEPKNPAPDLRDDGLDAFGRWIGYTAAHTDVNLAWPITFGRQGFVGGNPFSLSLHLLDESPIFTNLGSRPVIGAYKLRGLELLRGVDRALPTVLTGLNWFDAIDARQQGDSSKEMRFFLEGAFGLAASKAGILGGVMGFIWLDAKLSLWNVKNNMERAKEGREPIFYPSYPMAAPWAPMNP